MGEKFLVTATPPTTNGDLHIGHIAGPYLGADVFTRFQRLKGNEVVYVSGADDNQSYVVTTSARLGRHPAELCQEFTRRIRATLQRAAIAMDAFTSPDSRHEQFVKGFFNALHHKNMFLSETRPVWYCGRDNRYLFESYVSGFCPTCCEPAKGGICESCGHASGLTDLVSPRCTLCQSERLAKRPITGLFLQLETFRGQLEAFYETRKGIWRPHLLALLRELLAGRLIDYPITHPPGWGIRFPDPAFRHTVINVWAEMLPGLIHSAAIAHNGDLNPWHKRNGYELVQFLGYDNSFFFGVLHPALLMAGGDQWILPRYIITNEFYLLDYRKFSTSQGHVLWARDILQRVPCDPLRFYLCFSSPELHQSNFSEFEMSNLTARLLVEPLEKLVRRMRGLFPGRTELSIRMDETSESLQRTLERYFGLLEESLSPSAFSLCGASRALAAFISWVARYAEESPPAIDPYGSRERRRAADLAYALLGLIVLSAPIMPTLSQRLKTSLGLGWETRWELPASLGPVSFAALPEDVNGLF